MKEVPTLRSLLLESSAYLDEGQRRVGWSVGSGDGWLGFRGMMGGSRRQLHLNNNKKIKKIKINKAAIKKKKRKAMKRDVS